MRFAFSYGNVYKQNSEDKMSFFFKRGKTYILNCILCLSEMLKHRVMLLVFQK
jgi:hypothetical protein